MKNLNLLLHVMLSSMLCAVIMGSSVIGNMCYAQAQVARWVGGGAFEVDIGEFSRRPFKPLYVYMGVDRLRESIRACEKSLAHYDKEKFPQEYCILQIRIGSSYLALRTARRAENVHSAARHFDEAIKVCGARGIAREYYEAKIGLGLALTELTDGDRVGNLHEAVDMLREGVEFFKKEDAPQLYAIANNGLGFAHVHLYGLAGQRREDADAAEGYFREVLSVTSYEKFPVEYAKAKMGAGMLYASLLDMGGEDLEGKALQALWDARNIFSAEFFPTYYTEDLFMTSLVYARKGDYEKAEEFIQKAVKVAGETNDPNFQRYMNYLYAIQASADSGY